MSKNKFRTSREQKPSNDIDDAVKLLSASAVLIHALTELARVVLSFLMQ